MSTHCYMRAVVLCTVWVSAMCAYVCVCVCVCVSQVNKHNENFVAAQSAEEAESASKWTLAQLAEHLATQVRCVCVFRILAPAT